VTVACNVKQSSLDDRRLRSACDNSVTGGKSDRNLLKEDDWEMLLLQVANPGSCPSVALDKLLLLH